MLRYQAFYDGFPVSSWPTLSMPYLDLPGPDVDPFIHCPHRYRSFRKRLKRKHEDLTRIGDVSVKAHTQFSDELFREFLELEAMGWKGRQGGAIAKSSAVRRFYEIALRGASLAQHFILYALALNGKPVAMEIGLLQRGIYYSPKATYDEEFRRYSPGHLLTQRIIVDLVKRGVKRYDFLGPRARHKYVWTDTVRQHANLYIMRPSVYGRLAHSLVSKIAPPLKRLKYACWGDPQR